MISEVDLRDWEKVDFNIIKKDEAGRYNVPYPMDWYKFYEQVVELRDKQFAKVPRVLQKKG